MKKKLLVGLISMGMACSLLAGCSLPIDLSGLTQTGTEDGNDEGNGEDTNNKPDSGDTETVVAIPVDGEGDEGEAEPDPDIIYFPNIQICENTQYVSEYKPEYGTVYYGAYPVYTLDDASAIEYPKLQKVLEELAISWNGTLVDQYNYGVEEINNSIANGYYMGMYFDVRKGIVRRADSKVVSIVDFYEMYSGGMHPGYYYSGYNYDPKTGKEINIHDVITDIPGLNDAVSKALDEYYYYLSIDKDVLAWYFEADNIESLNWTLDYNGVTVYFNPYDLAPFVAGAQSVTISVKEYPEIFDTSYFGNTDFDYAVRMINDVPMYADLSNDGKLDRIDVYFSDMEFDDTDGIYRFYGYTENLYIGVNDTSETYNFYSYGADAYFVHSSGKDYIYVYRETEQSSSLVEYALGKNGSKEANVQYGISQAYFTRATLNENQYYTYMMTDLSFVRIQKTSFIFSWFADDWNMYIDGSGVLVPYDEYLYNNQDYASMEYYDSLPYEYTAQQSIGIKVINEDGSYTGSVYTLAAGETIRIYRTDTVKAIDFILPNGQFGRILIDEEGRMENGKYPHEYFNNIYMD